MNNKITSVIIILSMLASYAVSVQAVGGDFTDVSQSQWDYGIISEIETASKDEEKATNSEDALLNAFIEQVVGYNSDYLYFLPDDYDGDGTIEAFGITGQDPDKNLHSNVNIWFIDSEGNCTIAKSNTYGTLKEPITTPNGAFISWCLTAGGSGTSSVILGCKDGKLFEPQISGEYAGFGDRTMSYMFSDDSDFEKLNCDYIGYYSYFRDDGGHMWDPIAFDYDADSREFIQRTALRVFCSEPSLSTVVGDNFLIGVKTLSGDYSGTSVTADDKSIISANGAEETDGILYFNFTALSVGNTRIKINDSVSGQSAELEFVVNNISKNAYTINTVPAASKYGVGVNFSNFSGMTMTDWSYKLNTDSTVDVSFTIYNENYTYGIVEVYNANGEQVNSKLIEPYKDITSVSGTFKEGGKLVTEIFDIIRGEEIVKDEFHYKSSTISKENKIIIKGVPAGGYIRITSDAKSSPICGILNLAEIILKLQPAYNALNSTGQNDVEDALAEAMVVKRQNMSDKLVEKWKEGIAMSVVKRSVNTSSEATSFCEDMNAILDTDMEEIIFDSLKEAAKSTGESALVDAFVDRTDIYGYGLKAIFRLNTTLAPIQMMTYYLRSIDKGAIFIHNPYGNKRVCADVTVECEIDDDTVLDVYVLDIQNSDLKDIRASYPEQFKSTTKVKKYDINLIQNGKVVQPKRKATVTIALPESMKGKTGEVKIYRVESDGTITDMQGISNGSTITFETDHFSTYILAADEPEQNSSEAQGNKDSGSFNDMSSLTTAQKAALNYAVEMGIIEGYDDGSMQPYNTVTRAEFATMMCRMMGYSISGESSFSDSYNHWASKYIRACTDNGAISGIGDNKFDPEGTITFEQAIKIITILKGYEDYVSIYDMGGYPDGYIFAAEAYNLIDDMIVTEKERALPRVDIAMLIYNCRNKPEEILSSDIIKRYDYIGWFNYDHHRLAEIKKDDCWGVIDSNGNEIIALEYDYVNLRDDGQYVVAKKGNKYALLDISGRKVIDFKYSWIDFCADNKYLIVRSTGSVHNRTYGLITYDDKEIISLGTYTSLEYCSNEYIVVEKDEKYGVIDINENQVVPFKFNNINPLFEQEMLCVSDDNWMEGITDLNGNTIIPTEYDDLSGICVLPVFAQKDGKWGKVDRNNKIVVDFTYDYDWIDAYVDGDGKYSVASKDDKCCIIDSSTLKMLTDYRFDDLGDAAEYVLRNRNNLNY